MLYFLPWYTGRRVTTFHLCFTLVEGHCMVQTLNRLMTFRTKHKSAQTKRLPMTNQARLCRVLWNTCLSVTSHGKAVEESPLQVHDAASCPPPPGEELTTCIGMPSLATTSIRLHCSCALGNLKLSKASRSGFPQGRHNTNERTSLHVLQVARYP